MAFDIFYSTVFYLKILVVHVKLVSQSGRVKDTALDCKPEYNISLIITTERE